MKVRREIIRKLDEVLIQLGLQEYAYDAYEFLDEINGQGYSKDDVVAASIALVCKKHNIPISVSKIADTLGVTPSTVFRMIKKYQKYCVLRDDDLHNMIDNLCERLDFNDGVRDRAKEILEVIKSAKTSTTPLTMVAMAVYLAAKEKGYKPTKAEIAREVGITDVALRSSLNRLRNIIGDLNGSQGKNQEKND